MKYEILICHFSSSAGQTQQSVVGSIDRRPNDADAAPHPTASLAYNLQVESHMNMNWSAALERGHLTPAVIHQSNFSEFSYIYIRISRALDFKTKYIN